MTEQVFRKLAKRLDDIPNGFPATESGVELRLLAKIFSPEEAALAAAMRTSSEPADAIAARAGADPKTTYATLKTMARKGQIRVSRKAGQLTFGLLPFVVGIYEEQLSRIDEELALLFEEYFLESKGYIASQSPPIHRVIPVEEAVPAGIEIMPYERASELLENAKAWAVQDCICRVQQKLVGKGCDRPVNNCLIFAPVEGVFDHSETARAITKEEAFRILHDAEQAGLVHSPGNYRDGNSYICNCCTCCCGVLRNIAEFNIPTAIATSSFVASVNESLCAGCGDCLDRCQFGALALPDDVCLIDPGRCVGCGLCTTVCPSEALHLALRPEGELPLPPASPTDWSDQRARSRGLTHVL
jgi:electron transport complex protein RnfB